MIPTDMNDKTIRLEHPPLVNSFFAAEPPWHRAKYIEANASKNELIDEIIDLKRKLNAMVRLGEHSASYNYPQQEADEDLHTELVRAGYGGDEVPE